MGCGWRSCIWQEKDQEYLCRHVNNQGEDIGEKLGNLIQVGTFED